MAAMTGLDVKKLVAQRFQGRAEFHRTLCRRGHGIHKNTVDKWIERNRIPGDWWPELYAICEEQGRPLDLTAYMQDSSGQQGSILD